MTAEQLAQLFHETYEHLAPDFGYETRKASAKPWSEVPDKNKRLMVATCAEVLKAFPPSEHLECATCGTLGLASEMRSITSADSSHQVICRACLAGEREVLW